MTDETQRSDRAAPLSSARGNSRNPDMPIAWPKQGTLAMAELVSLLATSAYLDLVELMVVANVGQDYRDLANAGKAQIHAARATTRPAYSAAGQTRLFPASRGWGVSAAGHDAFDVVKPSPRLEIRAMQVAV